VKRTRTGFPAACACVSRWKLDIAELGGQPGACFSRYSCGGGSTGGGHDSSVS
jgi:hypothetical protein